MIAGQAAIDVIIPRGIAHSSSEEGRMKCGSMATMSTKMLDIPELGKLLTAQNEFWRVY